MTWMYGLLNLCITYTCLSYTYYYINIIMQMKIRVLWNKSETKNIIKKAFFGILGCLLIEMLELNCFTIFIWLN